MHVISLFVFRSRMFVDHVSVRKQTNKQTKKLYCVCGKSSDQELVPKNVRSMADNSHNMCLLESLALFSSISDESQTSAPCGLGHGDHSLSWLSGVWDWCPPFSCSFPRLWKLTLWILPIQIETLIKLMNKEDVFWHALTVSYEGWCSQCVEQTKNSTGAILMKCPNVFTVGIFILNFAPVWLSSIGKRVLGHKLSGQHPSYTVLGIPSQRVPRLMHSVVSCKLALCCYLV